METGHYIARLVVILILIALVGGMVGCPFGGGSHTLTIASTAGGNVTTPGEGTFTYARGTAVDLVAEASEGFRFFRWTGDVGTIVDVNSAITTITMQEDYSIRADFEF